MNNFCIKTKTERGAALLIFTVLFLFISVALVFGISRGAYGDILRYRTLELSKESFFAAEAGAEDALYRHRQGMNYSASESFTIAGVAVDAVRTVAGDLFQFTFTATAKDVLRRDFLELRLGSGASFSYGLQSDTGGIVMSNSASVIGNIYSNGEVRGHTSGSYIYGTVISAGPDGYVENITATGSIYAAEIEDSETEKNAYCNSISGSVVDGDLYCDSVSSTIVLGSTFPGPGSYQATTSLPLNDATIADLEAAAEAGGIIASTDPECAGGTYVIQSDITLGPVKIECNVLIQKNGTNVSIAGHIWVVGNFSTGNQPNLSIDPSISGKLIAIITDNPSDRTTSSRIILQNGVEFEDSGDDSYFLLISQNNDYEMGGSGIAISSSQSSAGDVLLYAGHGKIVLGQSGHYVGVAGLLLELSQSVQVIYETGAISLSFPDGPGGGYIVTTWREI